MTNEELRVVQLCQLDVAIEIKKICKKYNIPYFITGGTLRGAVLCKGFLPNDGDIDIGMLRTDYENFIKICALALSDEYILQNYHTEKNFGFLYSKIRIKGTEYIERSSKDVNIEQGIFVDIYPFDVMPKLRIQCFKQKIFHKLYKGLLLTRCGYKTKYDYKIVKVVLKKINSITPISKIYQAAERNLTKYNKKDNLYYFAFEGGHSYKERISRNDIESLKVIEFENHLFNAPHNYIAFLKRIYGDSEYEKIPNKDNHSIIQINAKDYVYKNLGEENE